MKWFTLVLVLGNVARGKVLFKNSNGIDLQDFGTYLQQNGLNFSLNGNLHTEDSISFDDSDLHLDLDLLPPEVEGRIYDLVHNVTLLNEEDQWLRYVSKSKSTSTEISPDVARIRKKRLFFLGIHFWIPVTVGVTFGVKDILAKKRFLLEKERTKTENLRFCYDTCVGEWTEWSSCDKQCGGGTQRRTRELTDDTHCIEKFKEFNLGDFTCQKTTFEKKICNELCPNGGEPDESGCSCVGRWDGICCEKELLCDYPGHPANGKTIPETSPSKVGSIKNFKCYPGYALRPGAVTHSECQRNEEWSNPVPICYRIACATPALSMHLRVRNPSPIYDYGESILFECDKGFMLQGPEVRKCQDSNEGIGKWNSYNPRCIEVNCPAPTSADIPNGYVIGDDNSYQSNVTFHCNDGYKMVGLSVISCTRHGRWNGNYPTCNEITCPRPNLPVNGDLRMLRNRTVVFSCLEGYRLAENSSRMAQCEDSGEWDNPTPTCKAMECDESQVEEIENGFVNGGIYRYPHSITFGCYPGFVLRGFEEAKCQENGDWSAEPPTCHPCPYNTYMEEWSTGGVCLDCPANSHTPTSGSSSLKQCLCDEGFSGPNGGPCQEIKCTMPNIPLHGTRGDCGQKVGQTCSFACNPGFIPSGGAGVLECWPNGGWSNEPLSCSACPVNTYHPVDEPHVCLPCPEHMETEGRMGQGLEGCVCTQGWVGSSKAGEACEDLNECSLMVDGLGCEDECVNTPGSFHCLCTRPGTVLDSDLLSCHVERSCKELTQKDAPDNGGLVCTHNVEESSRFCATRCNKGFDFAGVRPNSYETCDASTNFKWPFQFLMKDGMDPSESRIGDCIPEFLPFHQLHAEILYFSGICKNLTLEQQKRVKAQFVGVLKDGAVCDKSQLSCDIENVDIICGRRIKRNIDGNLHESVDFNFNVTFGTMIEKLNKADCDSEVCPRFKIPPNRCKRYCGTVIKNYAKILAEKVRSNLNKLGDNIERVRFTVFETEFQPEEVSTLGEVTQCANGQQLTQKDGAVDAYCVSCRSGKFLNSSGVCEACPAGTYQLLSQQTSCHVCPLGSYSEVGWSYCLTCDEGFYGENCADSCTCEHGKCDSQTGECSCESGWEGPNCSVDIDRCQSIVCPSGSTCLDRPAPQDGFDCVGNI